MSLSDVMNEAGKSSKKELERFQKEQSEIYQKCAESIRSSCESAEKQMQSDIRAMITRTSRITARTWQIPALTGLITFVLVLAGMAGVLNYQGKKIASQNERIQFLEASEQTLKEGSWGVSLHQGQQGRYIVFEDDNLWVEGPYELGNHQGLKLIEKAGKE